MGWIAATQVNVFKFNTLTLSVLQLTSTWHFVKSLWKVVSGQVVHLPPSHNAQILVGDHFDHQPDNRNALLCKNGCYHFDNSHASVTLLANNAFHYPPHTRNSQRRMPMTTEQWERENQDTLMEYFIDGDPSVNTAERSSTPRPETANIAASRPAVTRCWICGKALKSVPTVERIPVLAVGSSSYRFGQMLDIAAMPVGRKTTASVKRQFTLLF